MEDILSNTLQFIVSITTIVALFVAMIALLLQIYHNKLSVKPMGSIKIIHSEFCIEILLKNNGAGPLITEKVEIHTLEDEDATEVVIENLKDHIVKERWMIKEINNSFYSIYPGEQYTVLDESFGTIVMTKNEEDRKNAILDELKKYKIHFSYLDIYGKVQEPIIFELGKIEKIATHIGFTRNGIEVRWRDRFFRHFRKPSKNCTIISQNFFENS